MHIGIKYTGIKYVKDKTPEHTDKSASPAGAVPAAFRKFQANAKQPEQHVALVYKKAEDMTKVKITNVTVRMMKEYFQKESSAEINLEMRYFWREATGKELDEISDEGLKAMSKFLLQANDIDLIKSVLGKVKPEEVEDVFELLAEDPKLFSKVMKEGAKSPNENIKPLKLIIEKTKSEDVKAVIEILVKNPKLLKDGELIQLIAGRVRPEDVKAVIELLVKNPELLKDGELIQSIVAGVKPEDVKNVIELLVKNPELWEEGQLRSIIKMENREEAKSVIALLDEHPELWKSGLIKSILENVRPDNVKPVIELLLANGKLWKEGQLHPEVLNALLAGEDPVRTIKAMIEHPKLLKLDVEMQKAIIVLKNPVEIITAFGKSKDFTAEELQVLRQRLISGEVLEVIDLIKKHPQLDTLSGTEMHNLLTCSDLGTMLKVLGQALKQVLKGVLNFEVIKIVLRNIDPGERLTALVENIEKTKLAKLEYRSVEFKSSGFSKEVFEALSREPDADNTDFQAQEGYTVTKIFYADVNRLRINLGGDKPLWNDKNTEQDPPFIDDTEIDADDTLLWKKERIKTIQQECGYIEGVDSKENKKAFQKVRDRITELQKEWKAKRIQELLEFCGYVEGGDEEENRKAEKKALMVSRNCGQNMGYVFNRTNDASEDAPLRLSNGNKIQLTDETVDLTFSLTKNANGDILLLGRINARDIGKIQEFTPDLEYKECDPEMSFAQIEVGIRINSNGEYEQYDGGSAEYVLGVKGKLKMF